MDNKRFERRRLWWLAAVRRRLAAIDLTIKRLEVVPGWEDANRRGERLAKLGRFKAYRDEVARDEAALLGDEAAGKCPAETTEVFSRKEE